MDSEHQRFLRIQPLIRNYIDESQYIIIKLGTNLLTPIIQGKKKTFFSTLAEKIKKIKERKKHVVLVSSGAVGFGRIMLSQSLDHKKM